MTLPQYFQSHIEAVNTETSTTGKTVVFSFVYGPKSKINLDADNTVTPLAWLGHPIKSDDLIRKSGTIDPSYTGVQILFADKGALEKTPEQNQAIIARMRKASHQFLVRLLLDTDNVLEVKKASRVDIVNFTDADLAGCFLIFDITLRDELDLCTD